MRDKYDSEEEMEAKERWRQSEKYNDQQAELARQSPKEALSGREKIPFHECYILIEVDDDGEEHASFYSSPAARDKATLDAIWFGGPDECHKEEAEQYLAEIREKGFIAFEGDPPLRWRTMSDYVKEALPGKDDRGVVYPARIAVWPNASIPGEWECSPNREPGECYGGELIFVPESALAEAVRKERELRQEIYNNASDALESLFQLDPNNQKRWNFFYTRATAGLRKACKLHEDEAAKGPAPKEEQDR